MNKKGQAVAVGSIITMVIAVILVANLALPQTRSLNNLQTDSDTLEHETNNTANDTYTLAKAGEGLVLTSGSLTLAGLTVSDNYTVNYDTGLVTIKNETAADNYTATYTYQAANYLTSSSDRALWAVVGLAIVLGLLYAGFYLFGLL